MTNDCTTISVMSSFLGNFANKGNIGITKDANGVSQDVYGNLQAEDRGGGVVSESMDGGGVGDLHIRRHTIIPRATATSASLSNHDSYD